MLFSTHTQRLAEKYGLLKAAELLFEGGFSAIDVSMYKPVGEPFSEGYKELAKELCEFSRSTGLTYIQAHAPYCRIENYKRDVEPHMERAFSFASMIGVRDIVVHPMYDPDVYFGREEEHMRMNVDYYRSLIPMAKHYGLRIAAENMWIYYPGTKKVLPSFLASPYEMCELYHRIDDSDSFTMCLDIGHSAISGYDPAEAIRKIGSHRLGCIHAHDVDGVADCHNLPGTMRVDWDSVCRALGESGYAGSFNLEADNFYKGFESEYYSKVTRFMADTAKYYADKIDSYRA